MVVDIRYHLASLVAVFLALGLGILMGTTLAGGDGAERQEAWLASLERQLAALQERRGEAAALLVEAERERDLYARFAEEAGRLLIAGSLEGTSGAVVLLGEERGALEEVRSLLESAGASVDRLAHVRPARGESPGVAALLSPEGPAPGARAGELLAEAVALSAEHLVTSVDAPALWLSVRSERPADFVVFLGTEFDERYGTLLAQALERLGSLGVPAAVVAPGGDPRWQRLAAERELPYVGHAHTPLGRLSLVLLLAQRGKGSYGLDDGTAAWPAELLQAAARRGAP